MNTKTYRRASNAWSNQSSTGPDETRLRTTSTRSRSTAAAATSTSKAPSTSRVTLAAQNNIVVTGDLLMQGTAAGNVAVGTPMLGLVSANSVVVYHPMSRSFAGPTTRSGRRRAPHRPTAPARPPSARTPPAATTGTYTLTCTWTTSKSTPRPPRRATTPTWRTRGHSTGSSFHRWIYASLQTLQHSFWVQNYNFGPLPGDAERARLDRAALARDRRHRRLRRHRLPQGLLLRQPAEVLVAAVLPAVEQRDLGCEDDRRAHSQY